MAENKEIVLVDSSDIKCSKVYRNGLKILSFTFRCSTPSKKAMEEMKRVLLAYVKTIENTDKKFRIWIDVRSIVTPSFSMMNEQSGPAQAMEDATHMYVEKTAVITSTVGLMFVKKSLKNSPPKTPTKGFNSIKEAQEWILQ